MTDGELDDLGQYVINELADLHRVIAAQLRAGGHTPDSASEVATAIMRDAAADARWCQPPPTGDDR